MTIARVSPVESNDFQSRKSERGPWAIRTMIVASSLALALASIAASPSRAEEVADFYKGKSIDLFIGFGPGGGYDTYSRVLARHFGKFVPGNPTITPQNMPGGGGLTVANFIYNKAPRGGTSLAMFGAFTGLEPLFGNDNARFETGKFTWVGNMNIDIGACGVWRTSNIQSFDDMKDRQVIFGSSGKASTTSQHPLTMKNLLGIKTKVVVGYQGTKEINLAMRRGEVDGSCGLYLSSVMSEWNQDLTSGDLRIIIQFGRKNAPLFGDAVNIYDLLKTEEEKQIADIIFRQNEIGRPVVGTPEIPPDRVAALRAAFMQTMKDPAFLADAEKARIPIDPMTGEEVTQLFRSFYEVPASVIARAKDAMDDE
jgi:tripartite-type tricarboxylate transporter receptor subunit TctC